MPGVFHNSLLPAIVSEKRVGALSGMGYALSYAGAVAAFAIWFVMFQSPDEWFQTLENVSRDLSYWP